MITLDGSFGEGGGQILRTALSLSLVTGEEFRIYNIRANRKRPGLRSQHLAAVRAAAAVGQADVQGDRLGSSDLTFRPEAIKPGEYIFDIGTAGSTTLVLQTVLPALVTAPGPSALVLRGGTHNPLAPPFDFLAIAFVPLVNRMGPKLRAKLDRHGFCPTGGGKMRVTVQPSDDLQPLDLPVRGNIERCCCRAVVAGLPRHIAERELKVLKRKLPVTPNDSRIEEISSNGPGNVVIVTMTSAEVSDVVTGFGEKGVRAEVVAERTATEVQRYFRATVPVGEHLADQLIIYLAMAGSGSFVTMPLSSHALTNIEVIREFLPVAIDVEDVSEETVRVAVRR